VNDTALDDLARRLEELPREAWERPVPPPAPWPAEAQARARSGRLVLRPALAALAAAALVAVGVAGGVALSGDGGSGAPDDATRIVLDPLEGSAGAAGSAELAAGGATAKVSLSGLEPSGGDDFYELWLLGEDGELVSLGSFRVPLSGEAELSVPLPVDPGRFDFVDVSREPADGDPGHSSDSVLRGPVS
jgi:hypothetical protein